MDGQEYSCPFCYPVAYPRPKSGRQYNQKHRLKGEIQSMLTFTFAGDESGDVSFNFGKGASRYFVMAAIGTTEPESLRQILANVRQEAGLPANYEFHFNALSSARLRKHAFAALAQASFESWAVIVDKTVLPDTFRFMRSAEFYLYFVTELIQLIPPVQREGATLILDEFSPALEISVELRRFLQVRNIPRRFKRVLAKRSKSEPLIQVADLMAGAILRRDSKGDAGAYDVIEGKLKRVLEFRG
jgi:hypothetical protein